MRLDSFTCSTEKLILFKRSLVEHKKDFVKIKTGVISLDEAIEVPQSTYPLLVKIKMKYSWLGEFQKMILRAPYSEINIELEDSTIETFQTATSILEGGVFLDYYIRDEKDAFNYFNKTEKQKNKIKQFKIHTGNQSCWKEMLEYEWYELHSLKSPSRD